MGCIVTADKVTMALFFEGRLAPRPPPPPGLDFNLGFVFFCLKFSAQLIFSFLLRASSHQVGEKLTRLNLGF